HTGTRRRPASRYAPVPSKVVTNSHVVLPARQTAGAVKTPLPPGADSVCSSPPVMVPAVVVWPLRRRRSSSRSFPSFPDCTASPLPRSAGAVLPRSTSPDSSSFWSGGGQFCRSRDASGASASTRSPRFVLPSHGPLPVATSRLPVSGSTTAPDRAQIAESLALHVLGTINVRRSLQSELKTETI